MKRKRKEREEAILDEIREKVIEESENLKAEKDRLLNEKVNLEALQEMTNLPMSRIKSIFNEVKAKHRAVRKRISLQSVLGGILVTGVIAVIAYFFIEIIIELVVNRVEYEQRVSHEASDREYMKLVEAVDSGSIDMVKYHVLEEKIRVEPADPESPTVLMNAVSRARNDIIVFLLENGADVRKRNKSGQSIMDVADEGTNLIVKQTISTALINTTPEGSPIRQLRQKGVFYSEKAFLSLLDKKDIAGLKLFLEADEGPYSNSYDDKGIIAAAQKGMLDILSLLFSGGRDISDNTKNIALLMASKGGHLDVIDYLLDLGADINYKYNLSTYSFEQNFTPLLCAIREQNASLEHLLKKGADPNLMASDYDLVPLEVPIYYIDNFRFTNARIEQMRILIKYGADVNKKDKEGTTALEYARILRPDERRPIMKFLIGAGAKIPMTDEFFRELVFMNDVQNVKKFLDAGMDPNLAGFEHYDKETTALIKSVMLKELELAKLLIAYGADVNYMTPVYKKTPLLMAVINEDLSTVRLLISSGAKANRDVVKRIEDYYTWGGEPQASIRKMIE